jgi:hypothetical protein
LSSYEQFLKSKVFKVKNKDLLKLIEL